MYAVAAERCIMNYVLQDFMHIMQKISLIGEELKKLLRGIYFHKGRTDENGGHYDWLNQAGWGLSLSLSSQTSSSLTPEWKVSS